ncbi:MAG: DUF4468 domain-containing protein [Prevotella sp.]|nr:DUF4468 domain-containing protein [Prevotella sp.]
MRKIFIFIVVAFMCIGVNAQGLKSLSYSEVIQVEGSNSDDIYRKLKKWVAKAFVDANEVTKYDLENKEIFAKGRFPYSTSNLTWASSSGYVSFELDAKIKDGRFKITLDNFCHHSTAPQYSEGWSIGLIYDKLPIDEELKQIGQGGLRKKQYKAIDQRVRPLCESKIKQIIADLKIFLLEDAKEKIEDDNW